MDKGQFTNTEDIVEVKDGWYNCILKKPLKRSRRETNLIYNRGRR